MARPRTLSRFRRYFSAQFADEDMLIRLKETWVLLGEISISKTQIRIKNARFVAIFAQHGRFLGHSRTSLQVGRAGTMDCCPQC